MKVMHVENDDTTIFVASYILNRVKAGQIVIVADRPKGFLINLKRMWNKEIRLRQNEMSSTLNTNIRNQLQNDIESMRGITFSSRPPAMSLASDVVVTTDEYALMFTKRCSTLFVTSQLGSKDLDALIAYMKPEVQIYLCEERNHRTV